jgi:hypothetical protein
MYMRYRENVEKRGAGNAAPKRIIFYRGQSLRRCSAMASFLKLDVRWSFRGPVQAGA